MLGVTREDAIPWFLICKQALRGVSLETLSIRYRIPLEDIKRQLDKSIMLDDRTGAVRIRNNAEITQASARARNDLVSVLQEAIDELVCSQAPRLTQLNEFEKLLNAAARLFQWPTVTASRMIATLAPANGYAVDAKPTNAVNLNLIATKPEELAALAKSRELEKLYQKTPFPTSESGQEPNSSAPS